MRDSREGEVRSLAELPKFLIEPTDSSLLAQLPGEDVLARLLRDIRVNRCLQYCFEPYGEWVVDATPAPFRPPGSVSFHIVIGGSIWVEIFGQRHTLEEGDVMIFTRGSHHYLGVGREGRLLSPGDDLPPAPWHAVPHVSYPEAGGDRARILCGFLEARVLDFSPLMSSLPEIMVARTSSHTTDWLAPAVARLITEVDQPSPGGMVIVARLSEIIFIEILRRQMLSARASSVGWLSAACEPVLYKAMQALHSDPGRAWTQQSLAMASGTSKSALCGRFQAVLGMSPMKYLREWKLYLASVELSDGDEPMIAIAERAGYGSEAAFTRAFARRYGMPPARWRKTQRRIGN